MASSRGSKQGEHRTELPLVKPDKLKNLHFLGSGGFGTVHSGYHVEWGKVAVKKLMTAGEIKERHKKLLVKEAEKLHSLRHPNIMLLIGIAMVGDFNALIMENMLHGALNDFLDTFTVPWEITIDLIYDIVLGMNFLHTRESVMVHRDLKASNVLIGSGLTAKIADFGLSEWRSYSISHTKHHATMGGTVTHIPPESWKDINMKASVKFDVYAFGILLWEVLNGKQPFTGSAPHQVQVCICDGQRPPLDDIPEGAPAVLVSLMKKSWQHLPESRPSFQEIKETMDNDTYRENVNMKAKRAEFLRQISGDSNLSGAENGESVSSLSRGLERITAGMAAINSPRAHTDGREDFRNRAMFAERKDNTNPDLAEDTRPKEVVGEEEHRMVLPEQPAGENDYLHARADYPPIGAQSIHVNGSFSPAPVGPSTQLQRPDPSQSLRHDPTGLGSPPALLQDAQIFTDHNIQEDGPPITDRTEPRLATVSQQDVEHDALPSLPSPQSPNVEYPTDTDIPRGDSRGRMHGSPSTTSLPPPYSAGNNVYNVPTPMNIGIGNAQPVLLHEREGRGRTVVYNTGGSNKGFVQIGDGNYMVVNPTPALSQPRSRPKPPKGRQPTKSQKIISDEDVEKICKEIGNFWKALGYKLGLKSGELDALKHDYHIDGLEEIIRQMLWKWKLKQGKRATQAVLAKCLWDIDKFNLALRI